MPSFKDMKIAVALVSGSSDHYETDFEELVHIGFDITINAYTALGTGKITQEFADGVRDGVDALLAHLIQDLMDVSTKDAYRIVHEATKRCLEDHKKEFMEHRHALDDPKRNGS